MIVVKIHSGLGNQMFQYALGRSVSLQANEVLKLDLTNFNSDTYRHYQLQNFNIHETIASDNEIKKLRGNYDTIFRRQLHRFYCFLTKQTYINEALVNLNTEEFKSLENIYLDGFWQSEKYFSSIRDILLKDFQLKRTPSEQFNHLHQQITRSNAVSVHIRRGDYAENPEVSLRHGLCSIKYYLDAIDLIKSKFENISFFVFSDNIDWVKNNIKFPMGTTYMENLGLKDYEELMLMSACKHNIIANSTFSWWGAWLNQNNDKIIIAPSRWFNDNSMNSKDILPQCWTIIESH